MDVMICFHYPHLRSLKCPASASVVSAPVEGPWWFAWTNSFEPKSHNYVLEIYPQRWRPLLVKSNAAKRTKVVCGKIGYVCSTFSGLMPDAVSHAGPVSGWFSIIASDSVDKGLSTPIRHACLATQGTSIWCGFVCDQWAYTLSLCSVSRRHWSANMR